jgi:hypothetical protein
VIWSRKIQCSESAGGQVWRTVWSPGLRRAAATNRFFKYSGGTCGAKLGRKKAVDFRAWWPQVCPRLVFPCIQYERKSAFIHKTANRNSKLSSKPVTNILIKFLYQKSDFEEIGHWFSRCFRDQSDFGIGSVDDNGNGGRLLRPPSRR